MVNKLKKLKQFDTLAYFVLFGGLVLGGLGIWRTQYDPLAQFFVVLLLALFYIFWGLLYHLFRNDLTQRLFLEYLILAAIAGVVGFLVFIR